MLVCRSLVQWKKWWSKTASRNWDLQVSVLSSLGVFFLQSSLLRVLPCIRRSCVGSVFWSQQRFLQGGASTTGTLWLWQFGVVCGREKKSTFRQGTSGGVRMRNRWLSKAKSRVGVFRWFAALPGFRFLVFGRPRVSTVVQDFCVGHVVTFFMCWEGFQFRSLVQEKAKFQVSLKCTPTFWEDKHHILRWSRQWHNTGFLVMKNSSSGRRCQSQLQLLWGWWHAGKEREFSLLWRQVFVVL